MINIFLFYLLFSLMVSAPTAQSSQYDQQQINQPGSIFKCLFDPPICKLYPFDAAEKNYNDYLESGKNNIAEKHNQWLGMTMDGNEFDTDKFVICSPRAKVTMLNNKMPGLCYWTPNTNETIAKNVKTISPLKLKEKLYTPDGGYYYMFGEQGISVHITQNNEEILIGAPGVMGWKGTIIRYYSVKTENSSIIDYKIDVPNPDLWNQPNDTYFGYAISSGYFGGPKSTKLLYLASAPQANAKQEKVYLFDIVASYQMGETTIKNYYIFSSIEYGTYYGYNILTEDFNGDGFVDVAIADPLYTDNSDFEKGAVIIYLNKKQINDNKWEPNFVLNEILTSNYNGNGRFGTAISKIGDINQDGYNGIYNKINFIYFTLCLPVYIEIQIF